MTNYSPIVRDGALSRDLSFLGTLRERCRLKPVHIQMLTALRYSCFYIRALLDDVKFNYVMRMAYARLNIPETRKGQ